MSSLKVTGFSLIELMIVIAIIGIIATVGLPNYQTFTQNAGRAAAQADLMSLAAALERHRASQFSYAKAASDSADTGAPAIFHAYSPSNEAAANKLYELSINSVGSQGQTYRLKATPVSSAANANTGALYYFSDGRQAWDRNNDDVIAGDEYCWQCD